MHSYRDVEVTITDSNSGRPVAHEPFRVVYTYAPADSPFVYHVELRTPDEVRAETDGEGKAVVRLADYAWDILLYMNEAAEPGRKVFFLRKAVIRNGGTASSHSNSGVTVELCPVAKRSAKKQS